MVLNLENPSIKLSDIDFKKTEFNSLIIGFFEKKLSFDTNVKRIDIEFGGIISNCIKNNDFKAEKGEIKSLYVGRKNLSSIFLLGLGDEKKFTLEILSNYTASLLKKLRDADSKKVAIAASSFFNKKFSDESIIEKLAMSSLIGLYRFDKFKTLEKEKLRQITDIVIFADKKYQNVVDEAEIISSAVNKTRELTILPPNLATPEYVANYSSTLAKDRKLKCTIMEESELKKQGLNCFLAVSQGSALKPKMVILEYNGGGKKQPIILVGKGITFDSGGLNLKPYPYILNMKDDKGGASSVIHIIEACSLLKIPLNIIAIAPLCENMPSGASYRPDDVITSHMGITVEVKNTDAEGRMILADALSYSLKYNPQAIIDVATLTGASMIALGSVGTPIVGTDSNLISRIKNASVKSLEKVWEFPLWEEYDENLKSDIADLKHISEEGDAGVIIGAAFLKNFVKETPWVHIDIGTTVWSKSDKGMLTKGPTGATVRLLIEVLRNWK